MMLFEAVLCLALNIYFEARDQSVQGRVAVTQGGMKRGGHPDYPNNPCDVVYQAEVYPSGHPVKYRCQFSWFCDGKSDEPVDYQAFHDALVIVDFLVFNGIEDVTHGATHYHSIHVTPEWSTWKQRTVQIGDHIFYK